MRLHYILLAGVFLLNPSMTASQQLADSSMIRFQVSSLNSPFAFVGNFEGEMRIYPDHIEVTVEKGTIALRDTVRFRLERELTAIRVGLGKELTNQDWDMIRKSKRHIIEKKMVPGDEYKLTNIKFSIRRDKLRELSKYWLIIEIEEYSPGVGKGSRPSSGYAYAHSNRDIFVGH